MFKSKSFAKRIILSVLCVFAAVALISSSLAPVAFAAGLDGGYVDPGKPGSDPVLPDEDPVQPAEDPVQPDDGGDDGEIPSADPGKPANDPADDPAEDPLVPDETPAEDPIYNGGTADDLSQRITDAQDALDGLDRADADYDSKLADIRDEISNILSDIAAGETAGELTSDEATALTDDANALSKAADIKEYKDKIDRVVDEADALSPALTSTEREDELKKLDAKLDAIADDVANDPSLTTDEKAELAQYIEDARTSIHADVPTGDQLMWYNGDVIPATTFKADTTVTLMGYRDDDIEKLYDYVQLKGQIKVTKGTLTITLPAGCNESRMIKAIANMTMFSVAKNASLIIKGADGENKVILDGGAVWEGTPDEWLDRGTTNKGKSSAFLTVDNGNIDCRYVTMQNGKSGSPMVGINGGTLSVVNFDYVDMLDCESSASGAIFIPGGNKALLTIDHSKLKGINTHSDYGGAIRTNVGTACILNLKNSEFTHNKNTSGTGRGSCLLWNANGKCTDQRWKDVTTFEDPTRSYAQIENCEFTHNYTTERGGAINNESQIIYKGENLFEYNKSGKDGGAIFNTTYTLSGGGNNILVELSDGCVIRNNEAVRYGGGMCCMDNGDTSGITYTVTMKGGEIYENTAQQGGGLYFELTHTNNKFSLNLYDGEIYDNTAVDGAGVCVKNKVTVNVGNKEDKTQFVTIHDNVASGNGGGIYVENNTILNVSGGSIENNEAKDGGGVYVMNNATMNIDGGEITANTASQNGGGVYLSYAKMNIDGGEITDNEATVNGGGIYVTDANKNTETKLVVSGGTISGNTAVDGAGVYAADTNTGKQTLLTFTGGEITENTASGNGGAIAATGTKAVVSLEKDAETGEAIDIKNNEANHGGGLYAAGKATVNVTGGLVANNVASNGGGLYGESGGILNVSGGLITENNAKVPDGASQPDTAAVSANNVGVGGGAYVTGANTKFILKSGVEGGLSTVGIFNNLADFAADDVYADKDAIINLPEIAKNNLAIFGYNGYKIGYFTNWFEDYHPNDPNFSADASKKGYESHNTVVGDVATALRYKPSAAKDRVEFDDQLATEAKSRFICLTLGYTLSYCDTDISKVVDGYTADFNKEFKFTVAVKDNAGETVDCGEDNWVTEDNGIDTTNRKVYVAIVDDQGNEKERQDVTFNDDGTMTFTLKHGQHSLLKNLPCGGTIVVTEAEYAYCTTKYVATYRKDKDEEKKPTDGRVLTFVADDMIKNIECDNTLEGIIDTGVLLDTLPFVLLALIAIGGAAFYLRRKTGFADIED